MKEYIFRTFNYQCTCGFSLRVYVDCGIPMEEYRCRICGTTVRRKEG